MDLEWEEFTLALNPLHIQFITYGIFANMPFYTHYTVMFDTHPVHSFKVDGHDPTLCQKACCADSGCVAWTFADPQPLLVSMPLITHNRHSVCQI